MSDVVKLAVTKWLEDGEFCEAIFTDKDDLQEFADDWQMMLEKDKDSMTEEDKQWPASPHEVPVGIFEVVLNQDKEHNFGPTFDALMELGRAMDCCHVDDLLRLLFFEGFKAGMKYQAEQQPQPAATQ
jgi:hypothetical protein